MANERNCMNGTLHIYVNLTFLKKIFFTDFLLEDVYLTLTFFISFFFKHLSGYFLKKLKNLFSIFPRPFPNSILATSGMQQENVLILYLSVDYLSTQLPSWEKKFFLLLHYLHFYFQRPSV